MAITGLTEGQLPMRPTSPSTTRARAIKDGKLVTSGGRVLGVTATAATLPRGTERSLRRRRERSTLTSCTCRSDIGARALAAMRVTEEHTHGISHLC